MSVEDQQSDQVDYKASGYRSIRSRRHVAAFSIAALTVLAIGAAGGAAAMKMTQRSVELAPLTPTSIASLQDNWTVVTVKGKVAEIFGNKFIVQDETGRALVETGPSGDGGKLVNVNEAVSIQGRFDQGFLHASYIIRQNGKTEILGPPGPPRGGPLADALGHIRP